MIYRHYQEQIGKFLQAGKVIILYGPRQVGKTTLIQNFLENYEGKVFISSGDDQSLVDRLSTNTFSKIVPFFKDYDLIFIDEAQKIPNIGQSLKIIVDQIPDIKVIVTGSSSFSLASEVGEPLVGRAYVLNLFPISISELNKDWGAARIEMELENLLIYGSYPETLNKESFSEKVDYLKQIQNSYLYKDILELDRVKNSKTLINLLQLLAYQIGHEVSTSELANSLDISRATVVRYLDLLEKAFVIKSLGGYSKNLRKEITKSSRYYFYDNGIRNALINNFNELSARNDVGQLWENFLFIERLKKQEYQKIYANDYFWRTWDGKEIDFVEEREGKLFGFEFKYKDKGTKVPKDWTTSYPDASYEVINRDNYLNFIV